MSGAGEPDQHRFSPIHQSSIQSMEQSIVLGSQMGGVTGGVKWGNTIPISLMARKVRKADLREPKETGFERE